MSPVISISNFTISRLSCNTQPTRARSLWDIGIGGSWVAGVFVVDSFEFCSIYFFWFHQDELSGILIFHVKHILFGSNPNFLPSLITIVGRVLQFGSSHSTAFQYICIHLNQHSNKSVTINQTNFAISVQKLHIAILCDKTSPLVM